ncbi:hypothetical protein C8R47DRAFT_1082423 [Mycena vitilis]|nr:hypothetical protein C8R47DRAFT_1082423 [Mycena vitilis]
MSEFCDGINFTGPAGRLCEGKPLAGVEPTSETERQRLKDFAVAGVPQRRPAKQRRVLAAAGKYTDERVARFTGENISAIDGWADNAHLLVGTSAPDKHRTEALSPGRDPVSMRMASHVHHMRARRSRAHRAIQNYPWNRQKITGHARDDWKMMCKFVVEGLELKNETGNRNPPYTTAKHPQQLRDRLNQNEKAFEPKDSTTLSNPRNASKSFRLWMAYLWRGRLLQLILIKTSSSSSDSSSSLRRAGNPCRHSSCSERVVWASRSTRLLGASFACNRLDGGAGRFPPSSKLLDCLVAADKCVEEHTTETPILLRHASIRAPQDRALSQQLPVDRLEVGDSISTFRAKEDVKRRLEVPATLSLMCTVAMTRWMSSMSETSGDGLRKKGDELLHLLDEI